MNEVLGGSVLSQVILVVEDEENIRMIIREYLEKKNFVVIEAQNGKEALEIIEKEAFDLAILDVMLPYVDGWTVCRRIKQKVMKPVIFLTARTEEEDELMGFELGGDDYVKKPFSPAVLLVRINKLLNKQTGYLPGESYITKDGVEIDKERMKVKVDNKSIELTHKEFQILVYLVENEGRVLSREIILNEIWGYDFVGDMRVVDNHIKKIRKALGESAYLIRTVFGIGYIFEVE